MGANGNGHNCMTGHSFKEIASDLDPLVITAPAIRSGTTLLQRLLCSSRRALIYGELCAQDLEFFLNLYVFKSQQYNSRIEERSIALEKVLSGDVNDWIPDLMPQVSEYLKAMGGGVFAGISYCRDYAISVGRPVWGFKHPDCNPATIRLMRAVMPGSRFIFIHRNLNDCLKSAKAQGITYSKSQIEEFCRSWSDNRNYLLTLKDEPGVCSIDYEQLIREPQVTVATLAEFTGLDDMDLNVLNHKINTWAGEDYIMQSKTGYFQPAELDECDQQIINATISVATEQPRVC
jgi:Sulfotransferase family